MKQKLKDVGTHEDLLISKGKTSKQRIQKQVMEKEDLVIQGCTFRPKINRSSSNLSSRMASSRAKSARGQSQGTKVFENLYRTARLSQEKVYKNSQSIKHEQIQKVMKDCTFKPNLSKTRKVNKSVKESNVYPYKEPGIMKFNNTQ